MKLPLTVALDVDDVLADTSPAWIAAVNARHGLDISVNDWTQWDLSAIYDRQIASNIYHELAFPDFYENVTPLAGAVDAVNALREAGLRCIFVTREVDSHGLAGRKWDWLRRHGMATTEHRKDYFEAVDKSVFRAELLVDDGLHNLLPFPTGGVLMNRPWNASAADLPAMIQRASGWSEAMRLICSRLALEMRHPSVVRR